MTVDGETGWQDAVRAAAMLAVAPESLGGAVVKAFPGPVRDAWLDTLRGWIGEHAPWRKLPSHVSEARLLGGLDLPSTLRLGRPVFETGLLAESNGGVVVVSMAERSHRSQVSHLCVALDNAVVAVERDGFSMRSEARLAVVALDEGIGDDEAVASALLDRLAFPVDLRAIGIRDLDPGTCTFVDLERARNRWQCVELPAPDQQQLAAAAIALEIDSMRPLILAARVARIAAALESRDRVEAGDLALAARLVLLPRASAGLVQPGPAEESTPEEAPQPPPQAAADDSPTAQAEQQPEEPGQAAEADQALDERVIESAGAILPEDILDAINRHRAQRGKRKSEGKSGASKYSGLRGRPAGCVAGSPRDGGRLNLLATLRAAAPWQELRRRELPAGDPARRRILVRSDDFRINRFRQRSESTVIFVVDASGSSALHRLAESKGAVELLLADCYVRRDRVALIAFRGQRAELLLPPTRSLVRAKRSLTALPGGGGTPLASGIDAAAELADSVHRRGGSPTVVVLTDGRANVCRDGSTGRREALEDALRSAAAFRHADTRCMVVDTSMRPDDNGAELARAMQAAYLPLPHADAAALSKAVDLQRDLH